MKSDPITYSESLSEMLVWYSLRPKMIVLLPGYVCPVICPARN